MLEKGHHAVLVLWFSNIGATMNYDDNRLHPFEWIGAIVWIVFWGVLGYIAITQKNITLGGRFGISSANGLAAVLLGFALIGVSLMGVNWLLRYSPFKPMAQFLLLLVWLGSAITYLMYFYH